MQAVLVESLGEHRLLHTEEGSLILICRKVEDLQKKKASNETLLNSDEKGKDKGTLLPWMNAN